MKDSISSQKYFREAATCYDKMLDTMGRNNKKYDILLLDKAVNLIIIDKQKEGNEILKQLYNKKTGENDTVPAQTQPIISGFINPLFLNPHLPQNGCICL